jgi:hypothetical protein
MTETLLHEKRIFEHLNFLRSVFTKRGHRHALSYINGLIFAFRKTIRNITKHDSTYDDHAGIQRLLNSLSFDLELLQKQYFAKIKFLFHGEISLVFDDTLIEREGKCVEQTQSHKDHCSSGFIQGHQFFTAMLVSENIALPLFPVLFSKKTESKIQMAKRLVTTVCQKFQVTTVLFDSWYSDKKLMQIAKRFAKRVICGIKANRNISLNRKEKAKIPFFIDDSAATPCIVDEQTYTVQELTARVKGISHGKVLIARQYLQERKNWSSYFYLFSSDNTLSAVQIIRLYQQRWSIEEFHRDIKQNLGFHPYVRKSQAIVRHAIFSTLAYAVLKIYMHYENMHMTIGECISFLRESNFSNFIKEIIEIEKKEERILLFETAFINKSVQV